MRTRRVKEHRGRAFWEIRGNPCKWEFIVSCFCMCCVSPRRATQTISLRLLRIILSYQNSQQHLQLSTDARIAALSTHKTITYECNLSSTWSIFDLFISAVSSYSIPKSSFIWSFLHLKNQITDFKTDFCISNVFPRPDFSPTTTIARLQEFIDRTITTATYRPSAVSPLPLTFRNVHFLHFFRLGRRTFRLGQAIHKMVIHGSNDGCRRWSWGRSGSRRGSLERRQRPWHFDVLARNAPNFGKVHPDSRVTR